MHCGIAKTLSSCEVQLMPSKSDVTLSLFGDVFGLDHVTRNALAARRKGSLGTKQQWNPVNMTTFGPWKFGRIYRVVVVTR